MINGYFMMPVQVLLDYTLAFSLLGVAGFLAAPRAERIRIRSITGKLSLVSFRRMIIGVVAGIALRMICHVLSGVIFFAEYAGEQNPWVYSIVYNGSYLTRGDHYHSGSFIRDVFIPSAKHQTVKRSHLVLRVSIVKMFCICMRFVLSYYETNELDCGGTVYGQDFRGRVTDVQ